MRNIIILIVLLFGKCNSQVPSDEMTEENFENKIFLSTLKNQLKTGAMGEMYETDYPIYKYSLSDLEAIEGVIDKELEKKGYIKPAEEEFASKINNIFGRIINYTSDKDFLLINFSDKCSRELMFLRNEDSGLYSTYIFKKGLFISDLYSVPEVFDYSKYPYFVNLEDSVIQNRKNKDLKIYYWKDVVNSKQRKENIDKLVHRNKYLFNDDKVSFDWLIKNDTFFMEQLVKRFGYTQDFELLEWVIKKTHYDKNYPEDYGSLFWVKNCDGSIKLHSNTFKILQKLYNVKTAYEILEDIKGYINYLGDEERCKEEDLTEEQRIKILANIVYFAEQYKYTDNSPYQMMGRLRFFLSDSQVDILAKNKYFNLPKFKEWWDKADYDEYYVTECEYEGSCGTGYHPLSEKEWRAQQKEE